MVLYKIDFCLKRWCAFLKVLNQNLNLNLKFHQMDFLFEFFNIHMNEKAVTCHDHHGFKCQNINIYPILIVLRFNALFCLLYYDYTQMWVFFSI
jgi:hypothetical protein